MRILSPGLLLATVAICAGLAVLAGPAQAQGRRALIEACRADAASLCSQTRPGGGAILRCLGGQRDRLSGPCGDAIAARQPGPGAAGRVERDVAYGDDPAQRMDIYAPEHAAGAPVIVMVHGGGWSGGSKSSPSVIAAKAAYWVPKGFIVISVEHRLLPQADPIAQAEDVARSIAAAQRLVPELGGDPARFVLMGHSSGAHLVMLLAADPAIATRLGARLWRGAVSLDSGAYNVSAIMTHPHMAFYDAAFGADPAYWRHASPQDRLHAGAAPMLLVCSTARRSSCAATEAFAAAAHRLGIEARVLPIDLSHGEVDQQLGEPGAYTTDVDRFIERVTR